MRHRRRRPRIVSLQHQLHISSSRPRLSFRSRRIWSRSLLCQSDVYAVKCWTPPSRATGALWQCRTHPHMVMWKTMTIMIPSLVVFLGQNLLISLRFRRLGRSFCLRYAQISPHYTFKDVQTWSKVWPYLFLLHLLIMPCQRQRLEGGHIVQRCLL